MFTEQFGEILATTRVFIFRPKYSDLNCPRSYLLNVGPHYARVIVHFSSCQTMVKYLYTVYMESILWKVNVSIYILIRYWMVR